MKRRASVLVIGLLTLSGLIGWSARATAASESGDRPPNVVIVFTDDQGYGDTGVYGAKGFETPNLDRMAAEGIYFTDFYAAAASCTPSRAALLTGCYPQRVGLPHVIGPSADIGINDSETTLAELLKSHGYATACFGKWHLGHHAKFLPTRHGFDEYFGLPYSNDMWPLHPTAGSRYPGLPLVEGDRIVNAKVSPADQTQLTTWYTERAVKFIDRNQDRPFFLYLPHSMPHVPLYVSDKFKGKSKRGIYGDVIMEIDWSVGQILAALKRHGIDDDTLVIFSSDNGPWLSYGDHAGSAGPLREGKGTTWDGGQREPCLMRWPGKIPAGSVCRQPAMTIDILPTIAGLVGADLPEHRIDGLDIWPLMSAEPGAKGPHEALFFYNGPNLQAVRSGDWKLHLPHAYRTLEGRPGGTGGKPALYVQAKTGLALFNLKNDIGEQHDVAGHHPGVVSRLTALAEKARDDLGDRATDRQGGGTRQPGRL